MSVVLFHRNFQRFQGGHLKVFHYFEHVRSSPSHEARIRFTPDSRWDESNPWLALRETVVGPEEQIDADVLFLAGMDWRSLEPARRVAPPVPVVNLIQTIYPRRPSPLHQFLTYPAVRICISEEVKEALEGIGPVNGPLFTVPIGLDLERLPAPSPAAERDLDCLVLAVKEPRLGAAVTERLRRAGYRVLLIDSPVPRDGLLQATARSRVVIHLPSSHEGAYLPALESMALGALVVCPDCVGNRSFCRDGDTCLVPRRSRRAIVKAARSLLEASDDELAPMLAAGLREAQSRALGTERGRFLEILDRVEELWGGALVLGRPSGA
jgi:hypothetical protein